MKKTIFVFIALWFCNSSLAQTIERQVIGATGNYIEAAGVRVSSSVGEVVINSAITGNIIVTQGFQQSDNNIPTAISITEKGGENISAYPNPTRNNVILYFSMNQPLEVGIDVFNELGQMMQKHLQFMIIDKYKQELSFAEYASGDYFIVVKSTNGKIYKGFKVQKIN